MLSPRDSHTSDTLSRRMGMGVSTKGATKYSLQRAILPMKLHDAGRWYVAWYGSNMRLPSPMPNQRRIHLNLGLQRGICKGDSLLYKGTLGNWEPPTLAVGCDLSGRCLPCPKELFGVQSESHPQVLFSYSPPTAWQSLAQGETLEMQPAHRLPQTSTRILMREPCRPWVYVSFYCTFAL